MGEISTVFNLQSPWTDLTNACCQGCARRLWKSLPYFGNQRYISHHSLGLDSVGMSYSYLVITIDYLSMLGLKLIIISKRGPRWTKHESVLWNGGVRNPLRKHNTNKAKPKRMIPMMSMVSCPEKDSTRHAIRMADRDLLAGYPRCIWYPAWIFAYLQRRYKALTKYWHVAPRLLEIFPAVAALVVRLCKRYVTSYWISREENHRVCRPTQDARFQSVIIDK